MISILRNALFLALFLALSAPAALARGKDKTPVRLDVRSTMDFEIIGAFEGYEAVRVQLPLSFYATHGGEQRRSFLPASGRAGHTLREVITKQEDLETKITARRLQGLTNNPHTEAAWVKTLGIWRKVRAEITKRLDAILRAANKRGETVLVEHGVTSYASLARAATAARRRLQGHGLLNAKNEADPAHAKIAIRTRAAFVKVGTKDVAATAKAKASRSLTGTWERKNSGWGVVKLQVTSRTKVTGTWSGGKRGRKIRGVMLKDGITARIQYSEDGVWDKSKWNARVAEDGKTLSIWSNWLNTATLDKK